MNDVLIFGGGYTGEKRVTSGLPGDVVRFPSHPVRNTGNPHYQPIIYEFSLDEVIGENDGNRYLIAVYGDAPEEAVIQRCIFRSRPNPIQ